MRARCPVCGREPNWSGMLMNWWACHEDDHHIAGPEGDADGTEWDGMCRTIRARALAEVRARVDGLEPPMTMTEALDTCCGSKPLDCSAFVTEEQLAAWEMCHAAVLALLDDKEDSQ